jgi:oligopeptide transport system substrate-binding protein
MIMRKLLLFLPFALILNSCSDNPSDGNGKPREAKGDRVYGGTLRFNETDKFQTLIPANVTDAISSHITSQVYEGLVKFDPHSLKVVPCLAQKWEMDSSGKVYTFHLRNDVKFHDDACFADGKGRIVTAEDVKYSFEQVCLNDGKNQNFSSTLKDRIVGATKYYNAGASAQAGSLEGVTIVDPQTIRINLEQSSNTFLYILANTTLSIIPKEAVEKYGDKMHVGTGPFAIANIAADTSNIILVRNNNYYAIDTLGNQLPFLDSIRISFVDNKKAELELFQAGELDFVWGLNAEAVKTFVPQVIQDFTQKPAKYVLDHSSEFVTQYYTFNTTRPPFDNVKVRQAFSYAIDRTRIVDAVLAQEAYGPGVNGICPPALPGYKANDVIGYETVGNSESETKAQKEKDRELARKLLAEAGYPNGKDFPSVKLVLNSGGSRNTLVADEVRNQLMDVLHVNLEIANVSFQQKLTEERYARCDMSRSAWVADYPSPENFLSMFYGADVPTDLSQPSYPNVSRYRNPEFDKLFDAGSAAKTTEEANKIFLQAEQLMMKDAPVLVLWYDENYRLSQSRVRNFFTNPMRYLDFSSVYLKAPEAPKDKKDNTDTSKKTSEATFAQRRKIA